MMTAVFAISMFAAGFIIGAVVVDRVLSRQRFAASREMTFEIRNPVDLSPTHDFRVWEGQ